MKSNPLLRLILVLASLFLAGQIYAQDQAPAPATPPARKPNIIFILMDDLGYGDIGKFWQNQRAAGEASFKTPNWDRMADEGMMLMQHYTAAPICAPSRASLLLGQTQGHCGLQNDEFDIALPDDYTIANVLKQQGYDTMAIGKWGLAGIRPPWARLPARCGFDTFYGYLKHSYGHQHYPGNDGTVTDGDVPVTTGLDLAYTTDLWTAKAKQLIEQHQTAKPDQPFFMYLAYDTPHAQLQAPTQAYPAGAGLHGGLQWPLNTNSGVKNSFIYPEIASTSWPQNAKVQATMIRRDDECVGDVLQLLRDLHIDKDTLVVFSSDNGPMGEDGESPTYFGSWGPFDGMKRDVYEGGIHMPAIAWWPSHIAAASSTQLVSGLWDWLATFSEAAGQTPPGSTDGISLLPTLLGQGKQQTHPYLYWEYKGVTFHEQGADDFFKRKGLTGRGEEQAVRLDDFVGLRYQITGPTQPLRLYNLKDDIHEDHDLMGTPAADAVVSQMNPLLITARNVHPGIPRPYDNELLPAVPVDHPAPGLICETYAGSWPWVPDLRALVDLFTPRSTQVIPKPAPMAGMDDQPYVTVIHGYVHVPADGLYNFVLQEDSGAHLWIHDAHVVNDDYDHKPTAERTGFVHLQAGLHPLRLAYRHQPGQAYLNLSLYGPTLSPQLVQPKWLFHDQ